MPGQANTVSTTTATLIMITRLMPAKVSTGISAFLKACLAITRDSGRPFRRASLMYSDPSTSSMDERVRRMCAAAKYQPSAKAGISKCQTVPDPEEGNQPSETENSKISTRPTQNEGSERPSSENTLPALSQKPPTRTAARMPLGMPINSEKTMAAKASSSELGKRDR